MSQPAQPATLMQGAQTKPALSCGRNWWPYIWLIDKFATHEWIGIFAYSLSSLHIIRHRYTNSGTRGPQKSHHFLLLLSKITDLLEKRRRQEFRTTLQKIWAHTNIRGNDLADAAARIAITQFDSLRKSQKLKVDVGKVAPRPPHLVMYTVKPPPPLTHLGTGTRMATLRQPWL